MLHRFARPCGRGCYTTLTAALSRQTSREPWPLSQRTVHRSEAYSSALGNDKPKPFLGSKAHKRKVEDAFVLTEEEQRRGKYAIPLGFSLFAIVIYFGFMRDYGEKDKAVIDFLTKDISDKIPPHKMARIEQQLEEEKEMYSNLSGQEKAKKDDL